jgi:hypothetical protein
MSIATTQLVIDKSERLNNLTHLDLSHNKIGNVSDNVFRQLNKLQLIKLSYQDSAFDFNSFFQRVSLEDVKDLNMLSLAGLGLHQIPKGITRRMEYLNFSHNELDGIPEDIFEMKNLRVLKLEGNNISEFDQVRMGELSGLQTINLRGNKIETFPQVFMQMKLKEIDLQHNMNAFNDDDIDVWKSESHVKLARTFVEPIEIVEGLYLGNAQTAQNSHYLKKLGVTHVLTVASGLPPVFPKKFKYKIVDVQDTDDDNLEAHFDECIQFIQSALDAREGVLVHCRAGVSRSASIVIAYVMKAKKMGVQEAMDFVKEKRNQICPNQSFIKQLENFAKK